MGCDDVAKKPIPRINEEGGHTSGAGVGVDVFGRGVVDPTKNVRELVLAESKYQDAMRDAETRFQNAMRDGEARRLNDLAALRQVYDARIAEDLRVGVKTTSEQLASQLIKETGSLSNLIGALRTEFTGQLGTLTTSFANQITALTNALTPRLADLERFRWESGGRTSVSDPATAEALTKMAKAIDGLSISKERTEGGITSVKDLRAEQHITTGQILTIAGLIFLGSSVLISAVALIVEKSH
jgi:hypothetical protein